MRFLDAQSGRAVHAQVHAGGPGGFLRGEVATVRHGTGIGQAPLACLQSAAPSVIAAVSSRCVDHAWRKLYTLSLYAHTLPLSLGAAGVP